ncbi:MAG: SMP-30/gluconolactonase/LRE family protein [Verrucomicrobia bacterium]|nr:SMP-30/gluconolactonase/LRE family protein [Verrucomicrobiota bacterium]
MNLSSPRLVADCNANLGEGPLWHAPSQTVHFTDIEGRRIIRYNPATDQHDVVLKRKGRVSGFTFERDGSMILFEEQLVIHRSNDGAERVLCEIKEGNHERFNDVKTDPEGRVYVGTMGIANGDGALIRVERGGKYAILMEGVRCGNGPAFSKDKKRFYFTDSVAQKIYVFDYDRKSGNLSNRRLFVDVPGEEGFPDGTTVDAKDHVWTARWGGHMLVRYRPDGSVERRIKFPARQVSSLTFGGPDCTDIYVTTAGQGLDKMPPPERGGALYHLNLGIRGIPEPASRLAG